jgi:hypothetical protein
MIASPQVNDNKTVDAVSSKQQDEVKEKGKASETSTAADIKDASTNEELVKKPTQQSTKTLTTKSRHDAAENEEV